MLIIIMYVLCNEVHVIFKIIIINLSFKTSDSTQYYNIRSQLKIKMCFYFSKRFIVIQFYILLYALSETFIDST